MNQQLLSTMEKHFKNDDADEETNFAKSIIPVLKGLPVKKKRLAKTKINQLLYEIEFEQ